MTTPTTATEAQADAYMAEIKAKVAAKRAATPARTPRRTKKERQLELMMAQYERDVAANPNTILWNPETNNFDAYRNGECVAQAGTYLAAEAARLELLARDLAHTSADSPAEVGELTAEEIADLADRPAASCWTCVAFPCYEGSCPACRPPALTTDEARNVEALVVHVAREVVLTGRCSLCHAALDGSESCLECGSAASTAHQAPKPLPTCRECGARCAVHGDDWCGRIPAVATTYETTAAGVVRTETTMGLFDGVFVEAELLPFELTQEDKAHDQAVLRDLERMAGVDDEAIVRRLAA